MRNTDHAATSGPDVSAPSYWEGVTCTTIGQVLVAAAAQWPHDIAVIIDSAQRTYEQMLSGAEETAASLMALGIRRGDTVGILMPTSFDFMDTLFAGAMIGAKVVPMNTRYGADELRFVVEHSRSSVVVTTADFQDVIDLPGRLSKALPELATADPSRVLSLSEFPSLRRVVCRGASGGPAMISEGEFSSLAERSPESVAAVRQRDNIRRIAMMLYTSGTTARPKAALLTNEAMVRTARIAAEHGLELSRRDRVWGPLPMFHVAGVQSLMYCLQLGVPLITTAHFTPVSALDQIEQHGATVLIPGVAPISLDLINHRSFAGRDLGAVRLVHSVAPEQTQRQIREAFAPASLTSGYGGTETSGLAVMVQPGSDLATRVSTSGHPLPGIEFRIDGNQPDEVGNVGEILVRGYCLFEGYFRDPEATRGALDNEGWFKSGDMGTVDDQGCLRFVGRTSDRLRVGGENVAAAEIEAFLQLHPAVHLAAVVGIPDARLEEVPGAFIQLRESMSVEAAELIQYCREGIASFKVPRVIRFVNEWPMSATKIQKFKLRDALVAELEQAE